MINQCSHMQNLRTDIYAMALQAQNAPSAKKREALLRRGEGYLERYIYLLLFNEYCCEVHDIRSSLYMAGHKAGSFKDWIEEQSQAGLQLYQLLDGLDLTNGGGSRWRLE